MSKLSKLNNKKLKLVAATSMTIFSLFALFMGTFAWFTANTAIDNSGASINVKVKGKFAKISYHQYTGTPTEASCSFNKTPVASLTYNWETHSFDKPKNGAEQEIDSFTLPIAQYDPINKSKPVLVLIELTGEFNAESGTPVYVNAYTDTEGFLGAKEERQGSTTKFPIYNLDGTEPNLLIETEDTSKDYYPLSSVIQFKSFGFDDAYYESWNANSTYNVTYTNTRSPVDHNFVYVDHDADESDFEQSSNIFDSSSTNSAVYYTDVKKVKYIAVIVDYYDAAIEYIYSTFLGDETLEDTYEYVLNFVCDWEWEIS